MNHELPDVQAGFRKVEEPEIKIANTRWIIKKRDREEYGVV